MYVANRAVPRTVENVKHGGIAHPLSDSTNLIARIAIDSEICHGKPCIRGLRDPVETILELLSAGMKHEEILADYDDLEAQDILVALDFQRKTIRASERSTL